MNVVQESILPTLYFLKEENLSMEKSRFFKGRNLEFVIEMSLVFI